MKCKNIKNDFIFFLKCAKDKRFSIQQTTMTISFTIADSTGHPLAGYSIGIFGEYGRGGEYGKGTYCARNPMVIQKKSSTDADVIGSILRDLDFSMAVIDGTTFYIQLFAFDPRKIRYEEIRQCYIKNHAFSNDDEHFEEHDGFFFLGTYPIHFDTKSMITEGESHFIFKSYNQDDKHFMKFTFYYMGLNPEEHRNIYHDMGVDADQKKTLLYYISNPMIEFSLNDF